MPPPVRAASEIRRSARRKVSSNSKLRVIHYNLLTYLLFDSLTPFPYDVQYKRCARLKLRRCYKIILLVIYYFISAKF